MSMTRIQYGYDTLNKGSVFLKSLIFEFIPLTSLCILHSLLFFIYIYIFLEYSHVNNVISEVNHILFLFFLIG